MPSFATRGASTLSDPVVVVVGDDERLLAIKKRLRPMVGEILQFQDESHNKSVRPRWNRQYAYATRQIAIREQLQQQQQRHEAAALRLLEDNDGSRLVAHSIQTDRPDEDDKNRSVDPWGLSLPNVGTVQNIEKEMEDTLSTVPSSPVDTNDDGNHNEHSQRFGDMATTGSFAVRWEETDDDNFKLDDHEVAVFEDLSTMTDETEGSAQVDTMQGDSKTPPKEPAVKKLLALSLSLLRSMKESEWAIFDNVQDEDDPEDLANRDLGTSPQIPSVAVDNQAFEENKNDLNEMGQGDELDVDIDGLFQDVRRGTIRLSTDEYNLLICFLATSVDLLPDEILPYLMEAYSQMQDLSGAGVDSSAPNATTYEILLLALNRRCLAITTAAQLVEQVVQMPPSSFSTETLEASIEVCEKRNLFALASRLVSVGQKHNAELVSNRIYHAMINMAKADDRRKEAIELLQACLKVRAAF